MGSRYRGSGGEWCGCVRSVQTFEQLRIFSGGLPLYVDSAITVALSEYGGDIEALCADLGQQSNVVETAQEVILARVYDGYDQVTQNALAIVSLADTGLMHEEVVRLISATLKLSKGWRSSGHQEDPGHRDC